MKKLNLKLDNIKEMLTKEQMKKIVGGYGGEGNEGKHYNCQCNGTGTWSGTYSSAEQVAQAISNYCSNGGSCTAA